MPEHSPAAWGPHLGCRWGPPAEGWGYTRSPDPFLPVSRPPPSSPAWWHCSGPVASPARRSGGCVWGHGHHCREGARTDSRSSKGHLRPPRGYHFSLKLGTSALERVMDTKYYRKLTTTHADLPVVILGTFRWWVKHRIVGLHLKLFNEICTQYLPSHRHWHFLMSGLHSHRVIPPEHSFFPHLYYNLTTSYMDNLFIWKYLWSDPRN